MSARFTSASPVDPGMVALAGGVTLYGPDGKRLPESAFRSPIDFGPGSPLTPRIEGPYAPREWQYSPGWNLVPTPRGERATGARFAALRALAASFPYARIAINHLKKKLRSKRWEIVPKDSRGEKAREKFKPEISRVRDFFRVPNRRDGLRFGEWISQWVEEALVLDAVVFYRYPDRLGRLHSYVQIDGATIKPIIDEYGHVDGFQQVLYGYPATQYSALAPSSTLEDLAPGALAYIVFNPKVDDVYGTPPLEEIQPLVTLGVRRMLSQVAWYTDGNIPSAFLEAPEQWSADTIAKFQKYLDDTFSGNEGQRHKLRLLPHGANYKAAQPFEFTKDEEEALISAICAHFGVSRGIFVSQVNRATGETLSDEAADVGTRPLETGIADILNDWIEQDLDAPDVEFAWVDNPSGSELELAQARVAYKTAGILQVNEIRSELGRDPLEPEEIAAMQPPPPAAFGKPGVDEKKPPKPGETKKPEDELAKAAAPRTKNHDDELGAWERFALKRLAKGKHGDSFDVAHLPAAIADLVRGELPLQKDAAGVRDVFSRASDALEKAAKALTVKVKKNYEAALTKTLERKLRADMERALAETTPKLKAGGEQAA